MKCQCQGCPDRHIKCHSSCLSYQAFIAEREKIKNNRLMYKEYDNYKYDIRIHFNNRNI